MSPDGCPGYPDTGVYYISTNGSYVGEQKVGTVDNIVVNNKKTVGLSTFLTNFMMRYDVLPGFLLQMAPCKSLYLRD